LDLLQVVRLLDQFLLHGLGVLSCGRDSVAHGARLQPKGHLNGGNRAAMCHQGDDLRHQRLRRAAAVEGVPRRALKVV
jgi:hypothetical protein